MNLVDWWLDKRFRHERRLVFGTLAVLLLLPPTFYLLSFFRPPDTAAEAAAKNRPTAEPAAPAPPLETPTPPAARPPLDLAAELVAAGKLAEAEHIVRTQELLTFRLRGAIAWQRNDLTEALRCFQAAVAAAPGSAIDLGNLAQIQMLLQDLPGAVASLRRANQADPSDLYVTNRLYLSRLQVGEADAVAAEVTTLLDAAPQTSLPQAAVAAAAVALRRGDPSAAATYLHAAKGCLPPEIFESLLLEPPLAAHAGEPALSPFYVKNAPDAAR